MSESKVSDILMGLEAEEARLRDELAETRKRTKELEKELKKVQAGARALGGKEPTRRKKSSKQADSSSQESVPAPEHQEHHEHQELSMA